MCVYFTATLITMNNDRIRETEKGEQMMPSEDKGEKWIEEMRKTHKYKHVAHFLSSCSSPLLSIRPLDIPLPTCLQEVNRAVYTYTYVYE